VGKERVEPGGASVPLALRAQPGPCTQPVKQPPPLIQGVLGKERARKGRAFLLSALGTCSARQNQPALRSSFWATPIFPFHIHRMKLGLTSPRSGPAQDAQRSKTSLTSSPQDSPTPRLTAFGSGSPWPHHLDGAPLPPPPAPLHGHASVQPAGARTPAPRPRRFWPHVAFDVTGVTFTRTLAHHDSMETAPPPPPPPPTPRPAINEPTPTTSKNKEK
jgi:hypothetical protein